MAGMSDDTHLALALLRVLDALTIGATNATARDEAVDRARKHVHAVLNRNQPNTTPADTPDDETKGNDR